MATAGFVCELGTLLSETAETLRYNNLEGTRAGPLDMLWLPMQSARKMYSLYFGGQSMGTHRNVPLYTLHTCVYIGKYAVIRPL